MGLQSYADGGLIPGVGGVYQPIPFHVMTQALNLIHPAFPSSEELGGRWGGGVKVNQKYITKTG